MTCVRRVNCMRTRWPSGKWGHPTHHAARGAAPVGRGLGWDVGHGPAVRCDKGQAPRAGRESGDRRTSSPGAVLGPLGVLTSSSRG